MGVQLPLPAPPTNLNIRDRGPSRYALRISPAGSDARKTAQVQLPLPAPLLSVASLHTATECRWHCDQSAPVASRSPREPGSRAGRQICLERRLCLHFLGAALFLAFVFAFSGHTVRYGDLRIKRGGPHFQDKRESHHRFKRDHPLTAFDAADILPVKVAKFS